MLGLSSVGGFAGLDGMGCRPRRGAACCGNMRQNGFRKGGIQGILPRGYSSSSYMDSNLAAPMQ